jgi:hypothetical protein
MIAFTPRTASVLMIATLASFASVPAPAIGQMPSQPNVRF